MRIVLLALFVVSSAMAECIFNSIECLEEHKDYACFYDTQDDQYLAFKKKYLDTFILYDFKNDENRVCVKSENKFYCKVTDKYKVETITSHGADYTRKIYKLVKENTCEEE